MTDTDRLRRIRTVAGIRADLKALSREIDTMANLLDADDTTPLQDRLGTAQKTLTGLKKRAKGVGL